MLPHGARRTGRWSLHSPEETHRRPWFDAWMESAYGPDGFWRRHLPQEHFATAATTGPQLAGRVGELLQRHSTITQVIDLGAGDGALLVGLDRFDLDLVGVDLRPRPPGLDRRVRWVTDLWDARHGQWTTGAAAALLGEVGPVLVVANEWLDDLPCAIVGRQPDGWRELVVDDQGLEQPGPRLTGAALDWADRWWPHGGWAEIGLPRDQAWRGVVAAVVARGGCALMIDYGHRLPDRPPHGTLTAYRDGRKVSPAPNGETNLTAHVAVDALQDAGEAAGARTVWCGRQRELPASGELEPGRPDPTADPVQDLVRRTQELAFERAWGDHWWLVQEA